MIRRVSLLPALLVAVAACSAAPAPPAAERIAYGPDPLQHVDLWRPRGNGPFPVVLMIHGGCWRTDIATVPIMDRAAADLVARGFAVWNVEYRGIDRPGGGYPGTFQDVATAADLLARSGARYRLKTDRIVAIGHSAGGHLALWLAARRGIPASSPLSATSPLPLAAVISLGGLPDLETGASPAAAGCGAKTVERLVAADRRRDPYADTSPARLPQPAIPLTLINGADDDIAPPALAEAYAARVGAAHIRRVTVPNEGHMDEIAPDSRAWAAARYSVAGSLAPR